MKKNNDWSDLESFESKGFKTPIYIKISKSKQMIFSSGFMQEQDNSEDMQYVKFYFSKLNNAIIFSFTNNELKEAYKLSRKPRGFCRVAAIGGFLNSFPIDLLKYVGKYIPQKENIPGIGEAWIIYLDKHEKEALV